MDDQRHEYRGHRGYSSGGRSAQFGIEASRNLRLGRRGSPVRSSNRRPEHVMADRNRLRIERHFIGMGGVVRPYRCLSHHQTESRYSIQLLAGLGYRPWHRHRRGDCSMTGWIRKTGMVASDLPPRQIALLIGGGTALLSPLLLIRLPLGRPARPDAKVLPRNPFIKPYLFAISVWNVGVGAVNPLFLRVFFAPAPHVGTPDRLRFFWPLNSLGWPNF